MRKIYLFLLIVFIVTCLNNTGKAQLIYYMVPDTGSQGHIFPVTILGSETFWTASTYVEIYFDSTGVYGTNVAIVNDTMLTATVEIWGNAFVGYHKLIVSDQFLNLINKDSALLVRLSLPSIPTLLLPPNNAQLVNTNPLFKWDTNFYAITFQIQVATDSLFSNIVKDTIKTNIQGYQIPDILQLNTYYWWRVKFFNSLGQGPWSAVFRFKTRITGINLLGNVIPTHYKLYDNYPNPFNPITKIKFDLPEKDFVNLSAYDITGRKIAELANQNFNAGTYEVLWNANNISSGIYFYRMTTSKFAQTKRMAFIK